MWSKEVPTEPGLYLVYLRFHDREKWGSSNHRLELMKAEFYNDPQQGYHNELMFYPQDLFDHTATPVYSRERLMVKGCLFCKFEVPVPIN